MKSKSRLDTGKVSEAITLYNKFRSPEATAKLLTLDGDRLTLQFEGSFCTTCGFYDYLEDFIFELKQLVDVDLRIDSVEEKSFQTFIVRHVVEK